MRQRKNNMYLIMCNGFILAEYIKIERIWHIFDLNLVATWETWINWNDSMVRNYIH